MTIRPSDVNILRIISPPNVIVALLLQGKGKGKGGYVYGGKGKGGYDYGGYHYGGKGKVRLRQPFGLR